MSAEVEHLRLLLQEAESNLRAANAERDVAHREYDATVGRLAVTRSENEKLKQELAEVRASFDATMLHNAGSTRAAIDQLRAENTKLKEEVAAGRTREQQNVRDWEKEFQFRADRALVIDQLEAELKKANELLNSPELHSFRDGVVLEAAHQRQRWGAKSDAGKTPADWFWLIGYLAGKALQAHVIGNLAKALHHTISTAAALGNWHAAILGKTDMRPGVEQPVEPNIKAEGAEDKPVCRRCGGSGRNATGLCDSEPKPPCDACGGSGIEEGVQP